MLTAITNCRQSLFETFSAEEIGEELCAVCPKCCTWLDTNTIAQISLSQKRGATPTVQRLLSGQCVLSGCDSSSCVLTWRGSTDFHALLLEHINGIKQIRSVPLLDMIAERDTLRFATDVIWAAWELPASAHRYIRRTFDLPSDENLIIWLSVVRGSPELAPKVFEQGYESFFQHLINESDHDQGGVSVAHWISYGESWNTARLALSLISPRGASNREEILLMPPEFSN